MPPQRTPMTSQEEQSSICTWKQNNATNQSIVPCGEGRIGREHRGGKQERKKRPDKTRAHPRIPKNRPCLCLQDDDYLDGPYSLVVAQTTPSSPQVAKNRTLHSRHAAVTPPPPGASSFYMGFRAVIRYFQAFRARPCCRRPFTLHTHTTRASQAAALTPTKKSAATQPGRN